jgi:hypothetical protein
MTAASFNLGRRALARRQTVGEQFATILLPNSVARGDIGQHDGDPLRRIPLTDQYGQGGTERYGGQRTCRSSPPRPRVMHRARNGSAAAPSVGGGIVDLELALAMEAAHHIDFPAHLGHRDFGAR